MDQRNPGTPGPEEEPSAPRNWLSLPISRRSLIGRGAGAGAALAGGALLAACGSSSSKSSSAASSGSSSASASSSAAATSSGSASAAPTAGSAVGTQIQQLLGLPAPGKATGQGMSIKMGCDFSLSGAGTAYGIGMYHGTLLGIAHVKASGGPTFQLTARDSPAGDVGKGTTNTREFGTLGIPAVMTSQGGGNGGGAPFYDQFKMYAMDAGAAVKYNDSKPFFYQGRAAFMGGLMPTMIEYLQKKRPQVKKISYLSYATAGLQKIVNDEAIGQLKAAGYDVVGQVGIQIGVGDYTTAFSQLQSQNADLIVSGLASNDIGVMLKQYATSGIGKRIVGVDWLPAYAPVAGPNGAKTYEFCFDYFNVADPGNQWGKLFVQEYEAAYHDKPIYYSANYYEQVFIVWALVRRIIAKGGDPTKQGTAYVDAINEGATFPSVYYGGTGKTGSLEFDLSTHALKHRPVAYGQALPDGTGTVYAIADTTGADFAFTTAGKSAPSSAAV